MTLGHIQRTQIKNIIAELNRQATEHQLRRRYLIGQIHADQSYQHEVKRLGDSYGWNIFRASPDGWRVYLREAEMDGFQFSPAVCELMNQVHVNEASLSCVLAKIEALSTLVVPVQSLPTEVLVMIFKAGCRMPHPDPVSDSGDPRRIPFPLLVSSVSRYWRDVAINTPSLWTNITIKQTKPLGWVPLCLQRSGGQLLDITIDCRPLATLTAAVVDDIVARLMVHIDRWHSFSLITPHSVTIMAVGRRLAEAYSPQLQHLRLSLSGSSGNQEVVLPNILQGGALALSSVRLDSVSIPWRAPPLVGLTMIDMRWLWLRTRLVYEQFRDMLAGSPSLTRLTLRGSYVHLHAGTIYPKLQVPTLRYLELSGNNVCRMSSLLITPALEELTLANLDETEFREFVQSLPIEGSGGRYPLLQSLTLVNAGMCTLTNRFTNALSTISHITVINSCADRFLELLRLKQVANIAAPGVLCWPHLRTLTLVDDVDYDLLYGVVIERATLGIPLRRLILHVSFMHNEQLRAALEQHVKIDEINAVDLGQ